jgi:hypothetical protein
MKPENTLIHILGFSGVGKYTIAKILHKKTGMKIVDNHLINNPIFGVIDLLNGGKLPSNVWDQTRKIRHAILETIETISPAHYSFIFTNILYKDDEPDQRALESIIDLTVKRKATYVPVRLHCDVEENAKRIVQPTRADRLKPINKDRTYHDHQLIEVNHPNVLNLDVTNLSAEQSADIILQHAIQCQTS